MFWFGLQGRRKIGALEARMDLLEKQVKVYDQEVSDAIDRLAGIAKRFTGRKGGRPPNASNGTSDETETPEQKEFSRHVL